MAELAEAHGSGSSSRNGVEVQVLSSAPNPIAFRIVRLAESIKWEMKVWSVDPLRIVDHHQQVVTLVALNLASETLMFLYASHVQLFARPIASRGIVYGRYT